MDGDPAFGPGGHRGGAGPAGRPATPANPAPAPEDVGEGSFRVCNETANRVSIAFGYRADKGWQSEGWWVAEPDKCVTVYRGNLEARGATIISTPPTT